MSLQVKDHPHSASVSVRAVGGGKASAWVRGPAHTYGALVEQAEATLAFMLTGVDNRQAYTERDRRAYEDRQRSERSRDREKRNQEGGRNWRG